MTRLIVLTGVLALSACAWLPDHSMDYRKAEVTPRLQVPEGMTMSESEDLYRVPEPERRAVWKKGERFEPPVPPAKEPVESEQVVLAEPVPDVSNTRIVLTRDGNDYPIIMMYTAFAWAWEYVGQSLAATDLRIEDRSREAGIFFVRVPRAYGLGERDAQIKLSHTVNGVQIAVLNSKGSALVEPKAGQAILQRLYDNL